MALYQAVPSGSAVTISYTPGTHPLRDLTGYNASALVNYQVSNGTSVSTEGKSKMCSLTSLGHDFIISKNAV